MPLAESELPLELPKLDSYEPAGNAEPPLAKATEWLHVERGGKKYIRETNTMPQWAGSCWYYLRYLDPKNDAAFCSADKLRRWLPVDLYVGGAEHAVLHLLYSRFWHKVLFDRGHMPVPEPFGRLVNQGMILGEMEFTAVRVRGKWVNPGECENAIDGDDSSPTLPELEIVKLAESQVEKRGEGFVLKEDPTIRVDAQLQDVEKPRQRHQSRPRHRQVWRRQPASVRDVHGPARGDQAMEHERRRGGVSLPQPRLASRDRRPRRRVQAQRYGPGCRADADTLRKLHHTIQRVTDDLDRMSFNTAISAMMELTNHLTPLAVRPRSVLKTFMLLLAPFAPHLAEEIWQALGGGGPDGPKTLAYEPWPTVDPKLLVDESVEIPVQINGKVRTRVTAPAAVASDKAALEAFALAHENVQPLIAGKTVKKAIVVPGKMVNLIVG